MKLLFVCEGNVNRSQMAATILKSLLPNVDVTTAGTIVPPEREGKHVSEVSSKAIAAMQEIGLTMETNTIHLLKPSMVDAADRIILVGPTPGGPLPQFLSDSPKLEIWDVPDPGHGFITHESARDMILTRVEALVTELQKKT